MLYVIKGGKFTPSEEGYKSEFYLLSFEKDARNNKGYIAKQRNGKYKLYFKWDWKITDKRVTRGKNYNIFEQFDSAIKFLLAIKISEEISLANWDGSFVEIVKLYKLDDSKTE